MSSDSADEVAGAGGAEGDDVVARLEVVDGAVDDEVVVAVLSFLSSLFRR